VFCRSEASSAPFEQATPSPAPRPAQEVAVDLSEMNVDAGVSAPASAAHSTNGAMAQNASTDSMNGLLTASSNAAAAKARTRLLHGAAKVMRALCKLSMRTSHTSGDASVTRGRVLAMELIAVVLINHKQQFRQHPQLMQIVKGDLGNCLLANCKSSSSMLQRLTCEVFVVVLKKSKLRSALLCALYA
jgi:hypothetical protein